MLKQMQYDKANKIWTGQLSGDFDAVQAPKIVAAISSSLEGQPGDIILDCKQLEFVDSMGLGALVKLRKIVEEIGCKIKFLRMKPRIHKLFAITGLEDSFDIEVEL